MYIIVPHLQIIHGKRWYCLPLSWSFAARVFFFFFCQFWDWKCGKKIPKHEANLVEFTLEKPTTSKCSPVVFFFWMQKATKNFKKNYGVVWVRYYVLLLSYWIMEEGLGGFFLVVGLAFSSQSMSHSLIHSLLTRRKASHYHHPSHCWVITYL